MEITSIVDIIKIGLESKNNWFRGQSKVLDKLVPSIFRDNYFNALTDMIKPHIESEFIQRFMLLAPSVESKLPPSDDYLKWLFLMQHHGLPTRLLDWSENILVAIYFACLKDEKEDGEVWSINPSRLNALNSDEGILIPSSKEVNFVAHASCHNNPKKLAELMQVNYIPDYPVAFKPPYDHPRMLAQQSVFTIHPKTQNGHEIPIDELKTDKYIDKIIIPSKLKRKFLEDLFELGITKRTLFLNLDSIADSIIYEIYK